MPNIKVDADFNEAIAESVALNAVLANQGKRIAEVVNQINTYNAAGKLVRSVSTGMTTDGQAFNAVLKEQRVLIQAANAALGQRAKYVRELRPSKITFSDNRAQQERELKAQERLQERMLAAQDKFDAFKAKVRQKTFDQEVKERNRAIDKEIKDANRGGGPDPANRVGILESNFLRVTNALKYFAAYRGFNFLTTQIEESVSAANKLQIQLSLIRTISQDNQTSFGGLQKQVLASSNRSGFSSEDTAKAFYDTVSNQVAKGGEKVKQFVDTASDLARVTGSTLPDAGNTLTSVINAYGKSAEDAERISAVLFRTVDEGRIALSETAGTFGRASVLGANLGVSFEELSATLAITTQKGFKTADAMTLITNLLIKLEKPTEETKKLFDELGVSTGEEAIRLFGFTGVLQKMVDLTKAGKVSASAFFDEIRGRKQFAIFEQSIGDIDKFKDKLNDLNATAAQFSRAKDIRGESDADQVNRRLNELQNFFTADVGTKVLSYANSFLKLGDSFTSATKESFLLETGVRGLIASLATAVLTYGVFKFQLNSTDAALVAHRAQILTTGIALAKYAAYLYAVYETVRLVNAVSERFVVSRVGQSIGATAEQQARINERFIEMENAKAAQKVSNSGPSPQEFISEQVFKQTLGFYAQLTASNKKLFDDIKTRSEEAGTALKVGFETFVDVLKERINELKKSITDARNEIERSQKAALKFSDNIADAKFNIREKYADDKLGGFQSQKIKVTEDRIESLKGKIESLYKAGDKDSVAEARRLQSELIQTRTQLEDLRQAEAQRQFDANPTGPAQRGTDGKFYRVRKVDLTEFDADLEAFKKREQELEAGVQKAQEKTIANSKKQVEVEQERLKRFEDASKKYQALTPYDKEGKVKKEFQDKFENFDPAKFNAEESRLRANVQKEIFGDGSPLANTGEDYRFKAAEALADFQKVKILELAALERQVFFDNQRAKAQAVEAQYKEDIKKQKTLRTEGSERQQKAAGALQDLIASGGDYENSQRQALEKDTKGVLPRLIFGNKNRISLSDDAKYLLGEAAKRREEANAAIVQLRRNQYRDDKEGIVTRPEDFEAARTAALRYIETLRSLYGLQKAETGQQGLPSVNGKAFTDLEEALKFNFNDLLKGLGDVTNSSSIEGLLFKELNANVNTPLAKLQGQFPTIANEAEKAAARVNTAFTEEANKGIDTAIKKIKELQNELQKLGNPDANKRSALDFGGDGFAGFDAGGGEVYAATGGVVGMFPGQPRGVDRYPVWAAFGETIVDAQTSRMYRPMLEAIMQRRMPRYMAGGGVVGGNTSVGDINVTVQGATTNDETGRSIATRLSREARRNNINLFRK